MDKRVVTFGELLLRLATPGYLRFSLTNSFEAIYGGAEANIAMSLAQFGINTSLVSRIPDNEIGRSGRRELKKWGVDVKHVQEGGRRIGLYYLEKGASIRSGNVIYDREFSSFCELDYKGHKRTFIRGKIQK